MVAEPCGSDAGIERVARNAEQPGRLIAHLADCHGRGRIGVVSLVVNADVDRNNVALSKHSLLRGNPMHDLIVDRAADARREIVQALERRHRALVAADEILGDGIEVGRCHSRLHRVLHQPYRVGENLSAASHDLDLALRLELDHPSSAFIARSVISSRLPLASIFARPSFFSFTQSITGAVCWR